MDNADVMNVVQLYADAVQSKFDFIKIILFGSYAKGNFNDDSDIDIAIVFKDYGNILDVQLELMRIRRKIDSRIEPHPFREREFDLSNPLANEIIKHGMVIRTNAA
jgi:predicted nucleotidyltransferase